MSYMVEYYLSKKHILHCHIICVHWRSPRFLERLKCEFENENNRRRKNDVCYLARNIWMVRMGMLKLQDGDYNEWQASELFIWTCINQTTNWLVHSWNFFVHKWPQTYIDSQDPLWPGLGGSHHLPPYSILYDWPRRLHPNVINLETPKWGVPKFLKLGFLPHWRLITFVKTFDWNEVKKSYSLCRNFSNNMWHAIYTHNLKRFLIFNPTICATPLART